MIITRIVIVLHMSGNYVDLTTERSCDHVEFAMERSCDLVDLAHDVHPPALVQSRYFFTHLERKRVEDESHYIGHALCLHLTSFCSVFVLVTMSVYCGCSFLRDTSACSLLAAVSASCLLALWDNLRSCVSFSDSR